VDTGNLVSNPDGMTDRPGEAGARAELFLHAMTKMGYAALHVGLGDLSAGADTLRRAAARHHVPLLSTNILSTATKLPAFTPLIVRKVGPLKVGLFGLMSTELFVGKGRTTFASAELTVAPPVEAAIAAVAALKAQQCDLIVVLTQLTRKELDDVLEKVPGIDLALGSAAQELPSYLSATGNAHFADAFQKGKYVGRVTVNVRANRQRFYAADARNALAGERTTLSNRIMDLQRMLGEKQALIGEISPERRQDLEREMALARTKLQRTTERMESELGQPKDASTLEFAMDALGSDIRDDPDIDKLVKDFQVKFPKAPGAH